MVSSLAKFFRISLSQGKDIIPHGKRVGTRNKLPRYSNITVLRTSLNFRTGRQKTSSYISAPNFLSSLYLKMLIYHGMEGVYDDGEITISVYEKDNLIHIDVKR